MVSLHDACGGAKEHFIHLNDYQWELYQSSEGFSEADGLAAKEPAMFAPTISSGSWLWRCSNRPSCRNY